MAKTRRRHSRIAQGLRERVANALKFGSERRNEVLDDLRNEFEEEDIFEQDEDLDMDRDQDRRIAPTPIRIPVPPVQSSDPAIDNPTRSFAEKIYGRKDEYVSMLQTLIEGYTNQLRDNPENASEIQDKISLYQERLDQFETEVEIIDTEKQIENIIASTNRILDDAEVEFDSLAESLEEDKYSDAFSLMDDITKHIGLGSTTPTGFTVASYQSNLAMLEARQKRYESLTNTTYNNNNYIKFFPENLIKRIYGEIESKIRKSQKEYEEIKDTEQVKASEMLKMIARLDSLIDYLPNLLENPSRFENIKKETDAILERVHGERKAIQPIATPAPSSQPTPGRSGQSQPTPSISNVDPLFVVMVEQNVKKISNKIVELASEFKANDDELDELVEYFQEQIDKAPRVDDETKKRVVEEAYERSSKKILEYFGEKLYDFICDYSNYYEKYRQTLAKCSYGTQEFERAYSNMKHLIDMMISDGMNAGISVIFDEEKQTLKIDFVSDKVKAFTSQIVSDEVAKIMAKSSPDNSLKDKETREFTEKVKELLTRYDAVYADYLGKLILPRELSEIIEELDNLANDNSSYTSLPLDEKEYIKNKLLFELTEEQDIRYGRDFIYFATISLFSQYIKIDFDTINNKEFGTQDFVDEYTILLNSINEFRNNVFALPDADKYIDSMNFDEETQVLSIKYRNPEMPEFRRQIVSDEILQKINVAKGKGAQQSTQQPAPSGNRQSAPQSAPSGNRHPAPQSTPRGSGQSAPQPQPVPVGGRPTPRSANNNLNDPDFIAAKENYIDSVNELNYLVETINDLNSRIESQASLTFIDINGAKSIAEMEREAKALDQQMINLKIELSKERLAIKKQFNVFILSLPEVKNLTISEVEFSGSLENFIAQRDEMIVEAESKIISLDAERKNNPQNASVIANEINVLVDFIEAQNSIIGRRLVSECKTNNIDIVETLKARRESKKDMRDRLKNISSYQPGHDAPTPTPQPQDKNEELEREYRSKVVEILVEELENKMFEVRMGGYYGKPSINLSNRCNQNLFMLESNPQYASVNKAQIRTEELQGLDDEFERMIKTEQIDVISRLIDEINKLTSGLTPDIVNDIALEDKLKSEIDTIIERYPELNNLKCHLNLEKNSLILLLSKNTYDFKEGRYFVENVESRDAEVLSPELRAIYEKAIKSHGASDDLDSDEVKISTRQLTFNPKNKVQIASKESSLVMEGNEVTISLIKNGIRIRYSQELREKLSQLNAKINLVNKENYRSRTSATIDSDTQELVFSDGREIKPEDYKIEIRVPSNDESTVLFEYDLEKAEEELKARSR